MKTYLTRCALQALFLLLPLLQPALSAQTNVRAWYADGQVWVVWQATLPLPETFAIYKKTTAFSNKKPSAATLLSRPFLITAWNRKTTTPGPARSASTMVMATTGAPGAAGIVGTVHSKMTMYG